MDRLLVRMSDWYIGFEFAGMPPLNPFMLTAFLPLLLGLSKWSWARHVAVVTLFLPGLVFAVDMCVFGVTWDCAITRMTFWRGATHDGGIGFFGAFWLATGMNLLFWVVAERVLRGGLGWRTRPPVPWELVARYSAAALLITAALGSYLYTYNTLEDAVRMDDVALAKARLEFNLQGVDANTGYVESVSGSGYIGQPLLPLAIEQNSTEMVELLLQYGADIRNPEGRYGGVSLGGALQHADYAMVKLLSEKGMDQGLLRVTAKRILSEADAPEDTEAIAFLESLVRRTEPARNSSGTDAAPEPQPPRRPTQESCTDG